MSKWKEIYWNDFKRFVWNYGLMIVVVVGSIGESTTLSEDEIISYVRTQIAAYKCPKSIKFINELPRNPSGKILRRELRDPYWEGIDRKVSGN